MTLRQLRRRQFVQAERLRDARDRVGMRIAAKTAVHDSQDRMHALLEMVRLDMLQAAEPERVRVEMDEAGTVYWLREVDPRALTLAARPRLTGGDEARGLGGEERGRSCDGVSSAGPLASGEGSLCGSGRVPLPSGEGEGARGEWSDFVRGGGNERGCALAGRAGAPRESLEGGA